MIQHAGAALRVVDGGHFPGGLVVNHISFFRFGMDDLPVHPHFVAVLHLGAHFGNGDSVHLHLPGSDHFLRPAAAGHPAQGHVFL